MPKAQETILEIDLKALERNFNFLKSRLQPDTKFMAVVKAFAYGSDAVIVAQKLQGLGVDYFAVAYTNEGVELRDNGITQPILVLHPLPISFKEIISRCLEPNLYNAKTLTKFKACAEAENQTNYPVHIKFNTGLNRLGFWETDVNFIANTLKESSALKVKSIFSHLAASEDLNESQFSLNQIKSFGKSAEKLSEQLGYTPLKHMLNTSGILNFPQAQYDMVRSGIGLYGFGNSDEYKDNLEPIAQLKSVISQIHKIEPGESVGYNRSYKSDAFKKTATIPIGHADGIGRHYGNGKGIIEINGKPAPIIGNVCMDMIMVDVTDIKCSEGDEVLVFGKIRSAADFASGADTISYEIITAISQRVKRIIIS